MGKKEVVVIGQGYVGLPLALRATEAGFSVVGLDTDASIVARLSRGYSHIGDISDGHLSAAIEAGYRATTDDRVIATAAVVVVCVPTPLRPDGGPDLSAVMSAARMIGQHVQRGSLVILESTTHPGTTEEIFAPLVLGDRFASNDIDIAFSPERIDPGNDVFSVKNTPKVVGGITDKATVAACQFYSTCIDVVISAKGAKEAEMAKLIENTFRHVNIALVNEMLRFSNDLGIDLWNSIDCAETKPFGYMAFRPGPGVGGHCIPIDPSYLSHQVRAQLGYSFRMVELAEEINSAAPLYVADRLWTLLNDKKICLNGAKILLVGVTYKPDVADCRKSPAVPIARRLRELGAELAYHDPHVPHWSGEDLETDQCMTSVRDVYQVASESDAVVLLQPHSQYDIAQIGRCARLLLDTRGVLTRSDVVHRL